MKGARGCKVSDTIPPNKATIPKNEPLFFKLYIKFFIILFLLIANALSFTKSKFKPKLRESKVSLSQNATRLL